MEDNYPKAYKEVVEILNFVSISTYWSEKREILWEVNKIHKKFFENWER